VDRWIALSIGNSRLHWAWFLNKTLQEVWQTPHFGATEFDLLLANPSLAWRLAPALLNVLAETSEALPELWIASVVPEQTARWQAYPAAKIISVNQVPLKDTYPTLGVDRALALWGAGQTYGWPVLVIDAGTAMTFTGADANRKLVGGAILPGLGLQVRSLFQSTAALPLAELPAHLPHRWARTTLEAIQSGTIYMALAGIRDFVQAWWKVFPQSQIILTGGDHAALLSYLQDGSAQNPQASEWVTRLIGDPYLVFWGMQSVKSSLAFN